MTAPKRPRDTNQLAKMMVDIASGNDNETKKKERPRSAVPSGRTKKVNPAKAAKD